MAKLAYFPPVETEAQLVDILSRAAWFLTFSPIERIAVFLADPGLAQVKWKVAAGMDPAIGDRFGALRKLIELIPVATEADMAPAMQEASTVLLWKLDAAPGYVGAATLKDWLSSKQVWRVDPEAVRMEGSFYIEAGLQLMPDRNGVLAESRARFEELAQRPGRCERAFVLATGPSVGDYARLDYRDALGIVCNSVILDDALMETVQPKIVVFADPIFHFGPSQYAASFREALIEKSKKFDFSICIPFKYYSIFTAAAPQLAGRTIAIPYRKERAFNFDLTSEFEVKTTANVLSFLMLPLATTFASRVGVLGCDGRPLHENNYFWSHNPATQINDKMANIRKVHPGFFNIDYDDYYKEHCDTLEQQLEAGERAGRRFECLAFSHIPALSKRMARAAGTGNGQAAAISPPSPPQPSPAGPASAEPRPRAAMRASKSKSGRGRARRGATSQAAAREGEARSPSRPAKRVASPDKPTVVLIDPDARDWGGHYMAYNDKLAAALESLGHSVKVVCNKHLDPEILNERPSFLPYLSVHSWVIGNQFPPSDRIAKFEAELASALDEAVGDQPAILYMYCGGADHASALARLVSRRSRLSAHINLFYAALQTHRWDEWTERYGPTLRKLAAAEPRLRVTVPTARLQRALAEACGSEMALARHPSTAVSDQEFALGASDEAMPQTSFASHEAAPSQPRILFPGTSRDGKGFKLTLESVKVLARDTSLRLVIRYYPHPKLGDEFGPEVERLPDNVDVVRGVVENEAFLSLFRQCHVSVLPYEPPAFAQRTSGLLIDSLYHGLPVVALSGTWLGDMVAEHGCGIVANDGTPERLATAVREVVKDYGAFAGKARAAARTYFAGNSWAELAQSIIEDWPYEDLLAPVAREQAASLDEGGLVAPLLTAPGDRQGMTRAAQAALRFKEREAEAVPATAAEAPQPAQPKPKATVKEVARPPALTSQGTPKKAPKMAGPPLWWRLYVRVGTYLIDHHPVLARLGRFVVWSLRLARRHAGLAVLGLVAILAAFGAAVAVESARWLFAGAGVGLAAMIAAGLAALYARQSVLNLMHQHSMEARNRADMLGRELRRELAKLDQASTASASRAAEQLTDLAGRIGAMEADAAKSRAEAAAGMAKQLKELSARIEAQLAGALDEVRKETGDLARQMSELSADTRDGLAKLRSTQDKLNGRIGALRAQAGKLADQAEQLAAGTRDEVAGLKAKHDALNEQAEKSRRRLARLEQQSSAKLDQMRTAHEELTGSLAALEAKAGGAAKASGEAARKAAAAAKEIARLSASGSVFNLGRFQTFNRTLSDSHVDALTKTWSRRLSVPVTPKSVGYLAHRACMLENQMHGRLATAIEDMTLRTLAALATKRSDLSIMEIGVLFGVGAAIIYDAARGRFDKIELTLIDPLEGYYNPANQDVVTAEPVNEAVLRHNLAVASIPNEDVRLVAKMSTDPEAINAASERQYDLLIIDADHSYAGVKSDFDNYASFVRLGGHIIFDDYNSAHWPDVTRFVDEEAMKDPRLALVGAEWRTAVFRVVSPNAT